MFASVLIANRGEIACRIARTARRLGLRVIAVYSSADKDALHVRLADEAHEIGPAPAKESYLVINRLIEAARKSSAECIHPGYGFLSENAAFAEACAAANIVFVGPPPGAIHAMGLKDHAKVLMEKAGVRIVPGYHGEKQDAAFLKQQAGSIGYPLLIKAVAGGGGKGMRRVDSVTEFDDALEGAKREARSAFNNDRVLLEKYILSPRHIEMQIFADTHGGVIHLKERDCTLQRRHQKVIEEAPAPGIEPAMRGAMGVAAVRAARAVDYVGAGTVEFIVDGSRGLREHGFWFMEMNTRLQVEHPVTEAVTGLDLVEWQFRIAASEKLPLTQSEIPLDGHAVEARIYAEDPARGFLPSTGKLMALEFPAGVRVDKGVEQGSDITPDYDPLIAKIIAHGKNRDDAIDRLANALDHTIIAGPRTNVAFLAGLCRAEGFRSGAFDTDFIDRNMLALAPKGIDPAAAARGAAHLMAEDMAQATRNSTHDEGELLSPWGATDAFQLTGIRTLKTSILVDGDPAVAVVSFGADGIAVTVDGVAPALDARVIVAADGVHVLRGGRQTVVRRAGMSAEDFSHAEGDGQVSAPMHGKLLALFVSRGDIVTKGQRLAVIEAMKMEHTITAPIAGRVSEIAAAVGNQVAEGAKLMVVAAQSEPQPQPSLEARSEPEKASEGEDPTEALVHAFESKKAN